MTRRSINEMAEALRIHYLKGRKKEKGRVLDQFCLATGYNRKSAIRLLRTAPKAHKARGRRRVYGMDVVNALVKAWKAADGICSKRLAPFLPELVKVLIRNKELAISEEVRSQLVGLSPSSIDRLLKPFRRKWIRRPHTSGHVRVPNSLKAQIPIRTFGEWSNVRPGSMQADLVVHCGDKLDGFCLYTMNAVDVYTSWTECRIVWGKGQSRVGGGAHMIRQSLPFQLRELHTDNGGEFINDLLFRWCRKEGIYFTRGRPYKKNDQAYVEQKNWSVPRRIVGYHRYSSKAAYEELARLYKLVCPYTNFFQPVRKVVAKERIGNRVVKRYDVAQTPYQRLLASGVLDESTQKKLQELYESLNPVVLRRRIDAGLHAVWELAEDRDGHIEMPSEETDKGANCG